MSLRLTSHDVKVTFEKVKALPQANLQKTR